MSFYINNFCIIGVESHVLKRLKSFWKILFWAILVQFFISTTPETQKFSDVFRGYRNGKLDLNGLSEIKIRASNTHQSYLVDLSSCGHGSHTTHCTKKWSFLVRISSVNVTKFAVSKKSLMGNFIFLYSEANVHLF